MCPVWRSSFKTRISTVKLACIHRKNNTSASLEKKTRKLNVFCSEKRCFGLSSTCWLLPVCQSAPLRVWPGGRRLLLSGWPAREPVSQAAGVSIRSRIVLWIIYTLAVCLCLCLCACVSVCLSVCVCLCVRACLSVCLSACMRSAWQDRIMGLKPKYGKLTKCYFTVKLWYNSDTISKLKMKAFVDLHRTIWHGVATECQWEM